VKIKRVLIVDDEPTNAKMVSDILKPLGDDYIFETAHSGHEAVTKIEQIFYTLVITDYHMPGITGIDLIQAVRQISPNTQVVLMTAYGSDRLKQTAKRLCADDYVDKPFTVEEVYEVVRRVVEQTGQAEPDENQARDDSNILDGPIYEQLNSLKTQTNAWCVLLVSSEGQPVGMAGQMAEPDIVSASALVAANFMAASELAHLFGRGESNFKSNYYEADDYNIYSYDVNGKMLLVVVFGLQPKPGLVWFYTKQAAARLKALLAQ
jgi:CheY-like chemotaxis protein